MKVFVSSTCFDLLDIRAEVSALLAEMGLSAVMSDCPTSEFTQVPETNSIETCLVNVRSSDAALVILNQRYGPPLGSRGFDDVSATHLEYRAAIAEKGKPVYFYVRDRLHADHATWKKNKRRNDLSLLWVESRDFGLFAFLDEHLNLQAKSGRTNWLTTFSNSLDLKAAIRHDLGIVASKEQIRQLVLSNQVPLFDVEVDNRGIHEANKYAIAIRFKNVGTFPAYNVNVYLSFPEDDTAVKSVTIPILASSQSTVQTLLATPEWGTMRHGTATIAYLLSSGHKVEDVFDVGFCFRPRRTFVGGAILKSKQYYPTANLEQPFHFAAPPVT